jgi:ribose 5-phosphate isomerase B
MAQTLAIGSDHAGYDVKELLKKTLSGNGWTVADKGTFSTESTDYPDYAHEVGKAVETGTATLGILVCGSGNGVCITANKHHGVRAALAWTPEIAELARQHNDANVVCIPARFVSEADAQAIADIFLKTAFEGGRHSRRVEKIEVN